MKNSYYIIQNVVFIQIYNKADDKHIETAVDVETLARLQLEFKGSLYSSKSNKTNKYYIQMKVNGKNVSLHRWIMGAKEGEYVDHINHDTTDNRMFNLRITDNSTNMLNRSGPQKNNKSGSLGVFWHKEKKKWTAKIKVRGKAIFIGYFTKKELAVEAYNIVKELLVK